VFLLQLVVDLLFLFVLLLSERLFLDLFVEFLAHQATALRLTKLRLFLLFIMKELVELLNGCPFVFFCNLRVDFSKRGLG
jgi:hypothetical protein